MEEKAEAAPIPAVLILARILEVIQEWIRALTRVRTIPVQTLARIPGLAAPALHAGLSERGVRSILFRSRCGGGLRVGRIVFRHGAVRGCIGTTRRLPLAHPERPHPGAGSGNPRRGRRYLRQRLRSYAA